MHANDKSTLASVSKWNSGKVNSNIVYLVNDVMRKRKGFNPEHSSTFAKALAKINLPEHYVRNPDRIDSIRWYRRLQDPQAPGPSMV